MIEAQERPQSQIRVFRYPGCELNMREITSASKDVDVLHKIEISINKAEYAGKGSGKREEMQGWVEKALTRKFASLNPGSRREGVVGTEKDKQTPTDEIFIATKSIGEAGKLGGYTLICNSEDYDKLPPDLQGKYAADKKIDISYVTANPDKRRSPDEIAESMMQTAMFLWEKAAGRTIDQLTGQLTPEQMEKAQKELSIFADAGAGKDETNYREGLKLAGFKEVHRFTEYDEDIEGDADFITHHLSLKDLANAFEQRRLQKTQT